MKKTIFDLDRFGIQAATGACSLMALAILTSSLMKFSHVISDIPTVDDKPQINAHAPESTLPDIAVMAQMGWFGHAPDEQISNGASDGTLSEFELLGISHSADNTLAGAYIAQKGQPESYYRIGDVLPNEAGILENVFADHVNIRHGQALLSLNFPQKSATP